MSIEIGADPAPETYPNETEHRALIARHSRSVGDAVKGMVNIVWVGQVDTDEDAVFTIHTVSGLVASDLVFCSARSTNAATMVAGYSGGSTDNGGSVHAVAGTDSIAISHPSFSIPVTFNIMVVRP